MEAGEGLSFDVLAIHAGRPIRIQTKSTQAAKAKQYSFITARGRYATKNIHASPLTQYAADEIDLIACAALPIDKVLFKTVAQVTGSKVTIDEQDFLKEEAAKESFLSGLKELQLV